MEDFELGDDFPCIHGKSSNLKTFPKDAEIEALTTLPGRLRCILGPNGRYHRLRLLDSQTSQD